MNHEMKYFLDTQQAVITTFDIEESGSFIASKDRYNAGSLGAALDWANSTGFQATGTATRRGSVIRIALTTAPLF